MSRKSSPNKSAQCRRLSVKNSQIYELRSPEIKAAGLDVVPADLSGRFEGESRSAVRVVNFKSYKYSGTTSLTIEDEYFTPTGDIHHISKHQSIESSLFLSRMVNFTAEQFRELMNHPTNIRNMSVIAHVVCSH
jgi:hypothetical protein